MTMAQNDEYIRFDWAIKHILRDKSNFEILEGLISVLLNEKVTIVELLESEGNQDDERDKFNRVDIKAKNSEGHLIIVEVQLTTQYHYLERILYGASKAVCEHISKGDDYDKVKKVYSISILYCDYGKGEDYIYHGRTVFTGLHTGDELQVSRRQRQVIEYRNPSEVFPEYYIIRVNAFDKIATTPLEEWMTYLKKGTIDEQTQTPGLQRARAKLNVLNMSRSERLAYERHADNIAYQNDCILNARNEGHSDGFISGHAAGHAEGLEEGHAAGLEAGRAEGAKLAAVAMARQMLAEGMPLEQVLRITKLSESDLA